MNLRHRSVLPVPTSPVILMKPSPARAATSSVLSASWECGLVKKKLVSGVIENGISRRPKWAVYMLLLPCVARIEFFDAAAGVEQVLTPVALAFDDGWLDQHHQFALLVIAGLVAEQVADDGPATRARDLRAVIGRGLAHQAADCNDLSILSAHHAVDLGGGRGGQRQAQAA